MAEDKVFDPITYVTDRYQFGEGSIDYSTALFDLSQGLAPLPETCNYKKALNFYVLQVAEKEAIVRSIVEKAIPEEHYLQKDKYKTLRLAITNDIIQTIITALHFDKKSDAFQAHLANTVQTYVTEYFATLESSSHKKSLEKYIKSFEKKTLQDAPDCLKCVVSKPQENWGSVDTLCEHPRHSVLQRLLFLQLSTAFKAQESAQCQWILTAQHLQPQALHFLQEPDVKFNIQQAWDASFKSSALDAKRKTTIVTTSAPIGFVAPAKPCDISILTPIASELSTSDTVTLSTGVIPSNGYVISGSRSPSSSDMSSEEPQEKSSPPPSSPKKTMLVKRQGGQLPTVSNHNGNGSPLAPTSGPSTPPPVPPKSDHIVAKYSTSVKTTDEPSTPSPRALQHRDRFTSKASPVQSLTTEKPETNGGDVATPSAPPPKVPPKPLQYGSPTGSPKGSGNWTTSVKKVSSTPPKKSPPPLPSSAKYTTMLSQQESKTNGDSLSQS